MAAVTSAGIDPETEFRPCVGPMSERWWVRINRFWAGDATALQVRGRSPDLRLGSAPITTAFELALTRPSSGIAIGTTRRSSGSRPARYCFIGIVLQHRRRNGRVARLADSPLICP